MVSLATGRKFRGISLCDNIGMVTAFANDVAYDEIFAGQLKAILDKDDLVIAISGSGNSPNVVKAVEYANQAGAGTLAVVGYDGGKLKRIAKHSVWVPSFDMQLCEEMHLMFGHMVMKTLCGSQIED
jgi:D-sedoheptulose 7-phosphate isomerase